MKDIETKLNILKSIQPELKKAEFSNSIQQSKGRDRRMEKACQDFEAIFLSHLMKTMRTSTLEESGLFGKNLGGEIYQDLFESEVAKSFSQSGGIGLAEKLFYHFQKMDQDFRNTADTIKDRTISRSGLKPKGNLDQSAAGSPLKPASKGISKGMKGIRKFEPIVQEACTRFQVDPALVYAVIYRESSGNPGLVSSKGAKGLMQLMDGTASDLGVQNSFDPRQNILGGTQYLKQMLNRFNGDLKLTLAAYNAGPGNVERYGGVPPFRETREYINRVMESYRYFQDELPQGNLRQV